MNYVEWMRPCVCPGKRRRTEREGVPSPRCETCGRGFILVPLFRPARADFSVSMREVREVMQVGDIEHLTGCTVTGITLDDGSHEHAPREGPHGFDPRNGWMTHRVTGSPRGTSTVEVLGYLNCPLALVLHVAPPVDLDVTFNAAYNLGYATARALFLGAGTPAAPDVAVAVDVELSLLPLTDADYLARRDRAMAKFKAASAPPKAPAPKLQ